MKPSWPKNGTLDDQTTAKTIVKDTYTMLNGGLNFADNFYSVNVSDTFTHGVEKLILNPFGKSPPTGFLFAGCDSLTSGTQISCSIQPILNTSRTDGLIGITVNYDLAHTKEYMKKKPAANQTLTSNVVTTIANSTLVASRGTTITDNGAGVFTLAEAGTYMLSATMTLESAAYSGYDMTLRSSTAIFASKSIRATLNSGPQDTIAIVQDIAAGGNVRFDMNQVNTAVTTHQVLASLTHLEIHRLYNDSLPTARVHGVLLGS